MYTEDLPIALQLAVSGFPSECSSLPLTYLIKEVQLLASQ